MHEARLEVGRAREHGKLIRWLDAGLRQGRAGRLAAESPIALAEGASLHASARVGDRLASHALAHLVRAQAHGRAIPVALIGHVFTDPRLRGRGLARACVRAVMDAAASRALAFALFGDADALYAPLGFRRAGIERVFALDARLCAAALGDAGAAIDVGPARADDWPRLETLHDAKPVRIERAAGSLVRLAGAPGCEFTVARRDGAVIGYAALGRGDDLRGVVHEWAGEPDGVLACWHALTETHGTLTCLASVVDEAPLERVRAAGATIERRPLALFAVPDPAALWRAFTHGVRELDGVAFAAHGRCFELAGGGGRVALDRDDAIALLLGPTRPAHAAAALTPSQFLALRAVLPGSLYFWGFDAP